MRKIRMLILRFIQALIIFALANIVSLKNIYPIKGFMITICILLFVVIHIMPSTYGKMMWKKAYFNSKVGCVLLRLFLLSTVFSIIYSILGWIGFLYSTRKNYLLFYLDLSFKSCHGFIIIFKLPCWKDLHFF